MMKFSPQFHVVHRWEGFLKIEKQAKKLAHFSAQPKLNERIERIISLYSHYPIHLYNLSYHNLSTGCGSFIHHGFIQNYHIIWHCNFTAFWRFELYIWIWPFLYQYRPYQCKIVRYAEVVIKIAFNSLKFRSQK